MNVALACLHDLALGFPEDGGDGKASDGAVESDSFPERSLHDLQVHLDLGPN